MTLRPGNPMAKVLMALLIFQAIVNLLSIAGMVQVSDVEVVFASVVGLAATLLAFISAGLMRYPVGYALGWVTQLATILLGLLTPAMWFMGAVFAFLWVVTFVLGKRLDASPAA